MSSVAHGAPDLQRGTGRLKPAIWATSYNGNYLIGFNEAGTKVLTTIYTKPVGCIIPSTIKVDHAGNVWVTCDAPPEQSNSGAVAEFSNSGVPLGTYNWTSCPGRITHCGGYGWDAAANATNVFSALETFQFDEKYCWSPIECTYTGNGYVWWPTGSTSSPGTVVNLALYGLRATDYMDLDSSGNLWVYGPGCGGSWCGPGIAEVTNPTTPSVTFNWVVTAPTLTSLGVLCPAGVYVKAGNTLVLTDSCSRKLFEFSLPSGTPLGTLGPTRRDHGNGLPHSGGFNKNDTKVIQGDQYGWLDMGRVKTNRWKLRTNPEFGGSVYGAAYDPSDK